MNDLVVLPLAILVAGAALQALCSRLLSSRGKGWLAFVTSLAALAAVVALFPTVYHGNTLDLHLVTWDGPLSLSYHIDGLAQLFALMGAGIGAAVLLYSIGYMAADRSATRFYILMLVFIAGLINLVYSADMLLMYASWEVVGLCSFLLVGFWYTDREAAHGARKVLVMTHIAGYALLAAILILYARTGTTLWTDPQVSQAFTTGLFALMLIAALAKSVQFPLHTWIPSAMAAPTPVSALLHAACYVKAGVYLVARMHSFTMWPEGWQTTVVWIGTATMLIGVLFAMIQHDSKRLLAFHTVSQIGYMMLGLGLGTPLGIVAGLLHCLNHGLFKGGLFLGAGAVQHATGTRDMDKLGGLARRMPGTATLWLISAAGIAGVPLFNGFVSKWLLYVAALRAGFAVPALIAWVVSVLTMFSFMKASSGMFFGDESEAASKAHESPRTMLAGGTILATLCVVLGVAPQLAIRYVVEPALGSMGLQADIDIGWLGLSVPGGSWYATVGVLLALIAAAGGLLLYWFSRRAERPRVAAAFAAPRGAGGPAATALAPLGIVTVGAGSAPFTGGEPLPQGGRLRAGDFSVTVRHALAPFYTWVDPDRYYLAVWHATLWLCARAQRLGSWLERHALVVLPLVAVVVAVAAALAGAGGGEASAAVAADRWPLIVAVAVSGVCLLVAAVGDAALRRLGWLIAVVVALAVAGLCLDAEILRVVLLEAAAVGAFFLLLQSDVERRARDVFLLAVAISAVTLIAGAALLDTAPHGLVLALLLTGFAVKLALVPAYLWLPSVAERTPALLVGVIIAVVDVTAFAEIAVLRETAAWLFAPAWPWLALALLSAVGGAGLALAQRDIKRMLAFSSVTDAGFLLLAATLAGRYGLTGVVVGASAHALAKTLLFGAVAGAERDAPVTLGSRGLAVRHPLAAAGFLAGSLAALGVPPTVGFAGHWRIYETAYGGSWVYLTLLIVATALSVLAYARVIALCWWGPAPAEAEPAASAGPATTVVAPWRSIWRTESWSLTVVIVTLITVVLVAGVWPRIL